jgi:predicted aspartyl protease
MLPGTVTQIPFEFIRPGVPLIAFEAKVADQGPFKFILDTGNAGQIILSDALAKKLNLTIRKNPDARPTYGVGKDAAPILSDTTLKSFQVGAITMSDVAANVSTSIDDLNKRSGISSDGNLGHAMMKDWALGIDYKHQRLTFDTEPKALPGIPFELAGKGAALITVMASVNGGQPEAFLLDTGAGASVITPELADRMGITLGQEIPILGASGQDKGHLALIESLTVGNRTAKGLNVVVADFLGALSKRIGRNVSGVVGYDFLKRFDVRIDYRHSTLNFEEPAAGQ